MTIKVNAKTGRVSVAAPKSLGPAVDLLYELKIQRMFYNRIAESLKSERAKLETMLLKLYGKSKIEGAYGKVARSEIRKKDIPQIKDPIALFKYLKKTGDFDLLQRRLNEAAVKERWEADQAVPGIGKFTVTVVSCYKK